ncbi:MAG TPA: hypothetical protein VKJ00_10700 [Thermoanaerobaculia bacterium]|nr:hypothetical protein [Thermoanaerobaculia bacterium]
MAQNRRLRSQQQLFLAAARPKNQSLNLGLEVGDTLTRFELTDAEGRRLPGETVSAGRALTIAHFLNRKCDACLHELPDWEDFLRVEGTENVVFIACEEDRPLRSIGELKLEPRQIFTIAPTAPLRSHPGTIPLTVTLNSCGIVTGVFPSVTQLAKAVAASSSSPTGGSP